MQLNVVAYGYNPWSSMWKRTQTLVAHLAKQDFVRETLFVNPRVDWSHFFRYPKSFRGPKRESLRYVLPREVAEGVTAYTPLSGPWMYPGKPLDGLRRRREHTILDRVISSPFLLYVNNPVALEDEFFRVLADRAARIVFDWSDDFATFAAAPERRREIDRRIDGILERADLVLAVNPRLEARARQAGAPVIHLRNGTNAAAMRAALDDATPPHPGCARLRHPVIGYMGYLNIVRLDVEMLEEVARAHPEWSFAFAGPGLKKTPLGTRLPLLPNVHRFPPVPYGQLPGLLKTFDVCILPNRVNEHTAGNDPIKLFDYLGSGRPVVSTPTAGVENLSGVIRVAEGEEAFGQAIGEALGDTSPEQVERRLRLAEENSWQRRGERLVTEVRELLTAGERVR